MFNLPSRLALAAAGAFAIGAAQHADAAIIDFEDQALATGLPSLTVTSDDGTSFTFTSGADNSDRLEVSNDVDSDGPGPSVRTLFGDNNGDSIFLSRTDGGTFDLIDLDLGNGTFGARTTTITGMFASGPDQSVDVAVPGRSFVPVTLNFAGLTSVAFISDGNERVGVDNLNVVIPEPASLALMGLGGLLVLGRTRRA